jgi:hypothetical protein
MSYFIYGELQLVAHATCSLKLMTYKYDELQVSFTTQKLSCKASCKTLFFHSVNVVRPTMVV